MLVPLDAPRESGLAQHMKKSSTVVADRVATQGGGRPTRRLRKPCCAPTGTVDGRGLRTAEVATRRAETPMVSVDAVADLASLFAVLANPTRLRLLLALHPDLRAGAPSRPTMPAAAEHETVRARAELCACDLAAIVSASQSMTSHQLHLLRRTGLVEVRRIGKHALYRLSQGPHAHLLLDALAHVESARMDAEHPAAPSVHAPMAAASRLGS